MSVYLLSTVVAPSFETATIHVVEISQEEFLADLPKIDVNLCGHPVTNQVLRAACPSLPEPEKKFWQGDGIAYAARPKGGVRGAQQTGDTQVSLDDLEFCILSYQKGEL